MHLTQELRDGKKFYEFCPCWHLCRTNLGGEVQASQGVFMRDVKLPTVDIPEPSVAPVKFISILDFNYVSLRFQD